LRRARAPSENEARAARTVEPQEPGAFVGDAKQAGLREQAPSFARKQGRVAREGTSGQRGRQAGRLSTYGGTPEAPSRRTAVGVARPGLLSCAWAK
jgi:hypothetical protein